MQALLWHVLQISDVLDLEFASALAEAVPTVAWEPQRCLFPGLIRPGRERERFTSISDGHGTSTDRQDEVEKVRLRVRNLPLMPGFARFPISLFARTGPTITARLLTQTKDPVSSPLICTTPYLAPVAELWPGPVVYWLTDLIAEYASADKNEVIRLDRRLCKAATLVCPNSHRLEQYLVTEAHCNPSKIEIIPNATRASNLLPEVPLGPSLPPLPVRAINRPVAGVIGNLAGNMDWLFLERLFQLVPWLEWVFVGPTEMEIPDAQVRRARASVLNHPRAHCVGRQAYGALAAYARSFSVAFLPYRRAEPTWSGSSTRFYEHLAACRPMIATNGLEELTRKTELLTLVESPEQASQVLAELWANNFEDGRTAARWKASRHGTWQFRAYTLQRALAKRTSGCELGGLSSSSLLPTAL